MVVERAPPTFPEADRHLHRFAWRFTRVRLLTFRSCLTVTETTGRVNLNHDRTQCVVRTPLYRQFSEDRRNRRDLRSKILTGSQQG